MIHHQPVFKDFIIELLRPEDTVVLDATLGEGGHAHAFLEAGKRVIAFERDTRIAARAEERLKEFLHSGQLSIHHNNYCEIGKQVGEEVDMALFDLGISKYHYTEGKRGFSFQQEEPLNMRLDDLEGTSAQDIINTWREQDLADLFYRYGEETLSRPCARLIVESRTREPILTTGQLAELIKRVYRRKKVHSAIHPATKVFQSLRIEVNRELDHISPGIQGAIDRLRVGGRVVVIAYHSLEDRLVKEMFRSRIAPVRNYNKYREGAVPSKSQSREFSLLNKKIIRPERKEIQENPSARSACLRVLVRVR